VGYSMDSNEQKYSMRLPKWAVIVLGLSLLLNGIIYFELNSVKQEVSSLTNNVNHIESSVSNSISSGMNHINSILQQDASLVSEFKYELGENKDKRVDILLSIKPKSYTKGEKIYFQYRTNSNNPLLIQAESSDDIVFYGETNISIFDSMDIDLIIDNGNTKKVEKLPSISRPADNLTARIIPVPWGGSMSYDKGKQAIITTYEFELHDYGSKDMDYILSDVNLVIAVNEQVIKEVPMTKKEIDYNLDRYIIQLKDYAIPSKEDDTVKIYITAKDNKGFNYRSIVAIWKINSKGINNLPVPETEHGQVEVY